MTARLSLVCISLFAFGCSHFSTKSANESNPSPVTGSVSTNAAANGATANAADADKPKDLEKFHLNDPEGPKVVAEEFISIPTEVNPAVEKWISYFQGRGRDHMERYLSRSTRYEKLMKKVLRDNGLPEDLFYIALIESGFTSRATSHAAAVGYWQFIRGTGKRYGLEINKFIDERRDPVLATQAAAEYFKGLYSVFGSWYLAMASYNVGENRVKKEVMKNYTRDFWELAKKRRLPRETVNYVPKFIAAKLIAQNPEKYGFEGIDYMPPIEFDTIAIKQPVNLRVMADKMNYNYEDFKALNPKFKGEVAPLKEGSVLDLRIPVGMKEASLQAATESLVQTVEYIADAGETESYKIRRGDNLYVIARRYRTTVAYLRDLNDIPKGKKLKIGMRIQVPDRTPLRDRRDRREKQKVVAAVIREDIARSNESKEEGGVSKYYIVQSGDSLFSIAQKYNTSVKELKKLNNIRRGRSLRVGVKIKLPESDRPAEEVKVNKNSDSRRKNVAQKFHVVRRGENLKLIAEKYKVGFDDLKIKNKIKNPSKIQIGHRLLIPNAVAQK